MTEAEIGEAKELLIEKEKAKQQLFNITQVNYDSIEIVGEVCLRFKDERPTTNSLLLVSSKSGQPISKPLGIRSCL